MTQTTTSQPDSSAKSNGHDTPKDTSNNQISISTDEFLLHQYDALRGEILKHMELGHQLVTFAITSFGGNLRP